MEMGGMEEGDRASLHHFMSLGVLCGGVLSMKGLSWKTPSIASRLVRYARPAGRISEAWSSLPCSFCTSCSV